MKDIYKQISKRLNISLDSVGLDGVKFRGRGPYLSDKGFWEREQGEELQNWSQSGIKLLELTKDINDDFVWDIRKETGLKPHCENPQIGCRWYKNLMRWEFLIIQSLLTGEIPKFSELDQSTLINSFNTSVSARINCKKTVGHGTCDPTELKKHINLYGDLISLQIKHLEPNVILIGGCSKNIILEKVVKPIFPKLEKIDYSGWIYFCNEKGCLIINGYNPTPIVKKDETIYCQLADALKIFINHKYYKENAKNYKKS